MATKDDHISMRLVTNKKHKTILFLENVYSAPFSIRGSGQVIGLKFFTLTSGVTKLSHIIWQNVYVMGILLTFNDVYKLFRRNRYLL